MSKTANKTLIGAFVVGALALLCLAIAVFGSGRLFHRTYEFVLFFDSSVSGLNIGSPVVLQGVPVGRVIDIRIDGDARKLQYRFPVFVEIDRAKVATPLMNSGEFDSELQYLELLVQEGLRGRLAQQSLLTGQLMIEMNIFPKEERGPEVMAISFYNGYPVIPTIPSPFENIFRHLLNLPLDEIAQNALSITKQLDTLIQQGIQMKMLQNINEMVLEAKTTLDSFSELGRTSNALVKDTQSRLGRAFNSLEMVIRDIRGVTNPTSPQLIELTRTLREVRAAANAVHTLAETLNRHPESLLRGKGADQ